MSSTTPLTDAINALTTYANEVTGKNDTNLSDAVGSLVDGYGGGMSWDNLIENAFENTDVTYDGTTILSPIPILKCKINRLTLTNYAGANTTGWGDGGQWAELYAPNYKRFGLYDLRNCNRMTKVYLPLLTSLGNNFGLYSCPKLQGIVLPSLNNKIGASSFKNDSEFVYGDFKYVTNIEVTAFENCKKFETLIIRNTDNVATLANINAFNNTPFASGKTGGTFYVPQSLISSYQSASNWSTILGYENNQILPIEGSIYETQYADGTPISTT